MVELELPFSPVAFAGDDVPLRNFDRLWALKQQTSIVEGEDTTILFYISNSPPKDLVSASAGRVNPLCSRG